MNLYTPLIAEFGTILLAGGIAYAGLRAYGREKIVFFLAGSILWTSIIENLGVQQGSYTYFAYQGLLGSWYRGYFFWVGNVPLWVELGWIIVALSLFMIFHEVILPGRNAFLQAFCAGLFAVNMDAMIDPVAVANNLWQWMNPSIYIIGVPIYNWVGWFFLVFFYDLTFNYTVLNNRSVFVLGKLENLFLKNRWSMKVRVARFTFRIVVTNFVVAVVLTIISSGLAAAARALVTG